MSDIWDGIFATLAVVMIAATLMTYWDNKRYTARFNELMEKDIRDQLTEEEHAELEDMLRG